MVERFEQLILSQLPAGMDAVSQSIVVKLELGQSLTHVVYVIYPEIGV